MSPGRIHCPSAFKTSVPAGSLARLSGVSGKIAVIRSSETTTTMLGRGGAPVPSMTVAPRKAIVVASSRNFKAVALSSVERVLFFALLFLDVDRIDAGEAVGAGGLEGPAECLEHPLGGEVAERVRLDEHADLLDRGRGPDQLPAGRRVDAIVAGARRGR